MAKKKLKLKKKLQDMRSAFSRMISVSFSEDGFYFSSRLLGFEIGFQDLRVVLTVGRQGDPITFGLIFSMPIVPQLIENTYRFLTRMYARYWRGPKHQLGLRLYIPQCSTAKSIRRISMGDSETPFFYHMSAKGKGYSEEVITRWIKMQTLFQSFAEARATRLKVVRYSKRPLNKRGR